MRSVISNEMRDLALIRSKSGDYARSLPSVEMTFGFVARQKSNNAKGAERVKANLFFFNLLTINALIT